MKKRMDWVSNSSSSAFVIFGVELDKVGYGDLRETHREQLVKIFKDEIYDPDYYDEDDLEDKECMIDAVFDNLCEDEINEKLFGEEIANEFSIGLDMIGIDPYTLADKDLQGRTINQYVADRLNTVFGTNLQASDIDYEAEVIES